MDVQMPVMNGVDATHALRPVIRRQIDDDLAAGMDRFVAKPIEAAALFAALKKALSAQDVRTEGLAA